MNFQTIAPIGTSNAYLDAAFRKARLKGAEKKMSGARASALRQRESMKIDIIANNLASSFQKILGDFPPEWELSPFYGKLLHLTLDYPHYKKSLGAVHWARGKVKGLQRLYASKINKTTDVRSLLRTSPQFYGRVSSVIKQINEELLYLEQARRIMRSYPDIKEMPTVCIYGFPNVGKTTLLNQLTGSKAKVAAYAFTTTTINSGFMALAGKKVQVLDVPGTLARPEKMNPIERQAELVVDEIAHLIVVVVDPSETSGFSLAQQEQLLQRVREKPVIVYLSKMDLLPEPQQGMMRSRFSPWKTVGQVTLLWQEIQRVLPQ